MRRLEVRCCCQPQKVLGSLPVPADVDSRTSLTYPKISTMPIGWFRAGDLRIETRHLPVAWIRVSGEASPRLAIKAEGMTIEELRELHGFQEVGR